MKRVRHVQINFSQHSTYIQIVFCSKVSIYTQNSIQWEHTLTLIQYCFQGQNEVDPLLSLMSPCVLVLRGILGVFPLRMSTVSVCTLLKKLQVPYLFWNKSWNKVFADLLLKMYWSSTVIKHWKMKRTTI